MSRAVATGEQDALPLTLIGLLAFGGALAAVGVVLGGQPPAVRADTSPVRWPVADVHTLPESLRRTGPVLAWTGAVLFVLLWLLVLRLAGRGRLSPRRLLGLAAAWGTPLAVGPPVLSADVYSYLAQGELLRRGLSPYQVGVSALGPAPILGAVDIRWREVLTPYGPLGLATSRLGAEIGSHSIVVGASVLRFIAVCSVVLTVYCCSRQATAATRPLVLALIALNPIVLLHLVGGAHLDALMVGLVVAALAVFVRGRPLLGLALATAGGAVKAPALIVVAVLAVHAVLAAPGVPSGARRPRRGTPGGRVLAVGGVVAATGLGCAVLVPDGFGWIRALDTPGQGRTGAAPTSLLAAALSTVLGTPPAGTLVTCRLLGVVVAGLTVAVLLGTTRRRPPEISAGLGQMAAALLGPVTYVWYLAAPVACLAPRSRGRGRLALVALCAVASLTSLPSLSTPAYPWPPPAAAPAAASPGRPASQPWDRPAATANVNGARRQKATPGTAIPESLTSPPRTAATLAATSPSARPGTAAIARRCRPRPPRATATAIAAAGRSNRLNGLDSRECAAAPR